MFDSHTITPAERRWTLAFAVAVMLLTTVPYLMGFGLQGDKAVFSGFMIGVEDGNSYIAKMHSGAAGAWLFRTPYTTFPQRGALMFLPYILLGKLAAPPGIHMQLVVLYHLFRIVAGFLAILATYDFLAFFLEQVRTRRLGLCLAILGGGLGWLLALIGQDNWLGSLPLDFYSPESFGFLGLYGFPHLALARALLLWALLIYLRAVRDQHIDSVTVLKLSALWLLSGLVQPLVMLVIGAVIGVHLGGVGIWMLWRRGHQGCFDWGSWRRTFWLWLRAGILPGLLVIYNLWVLWRDPFMAGWTQQNIIKSPHPLHYLLAYGLLLPFAWVGGRRLMRNAPLEGWLLVGWLLSLPILAYAPVNLQRRLPEGIWIAWVTLSMVALEMPRREPAGEVSSKLPWPALVLLLVFPSSMFLLIGGIFTASNTTQPVFRPVGEVVAFEELRANAQVDQVVLTAFGTGNVLPAWAPLRVVIGHGPESVDLAKLRPQVSAFYSQETSDIQRIDFLRQFDVSYVFWGPAERRLGDWDPNLAPFLHQFYESENYNIYEFDRAQAIVPPIIQPLINKP